MEKIITKKEDMKRIPLYIQGLDENMEGGVPEGHINLICGTSGSMKSSLSFNCIYNEVVLKGKIALYVSLEQSYPSLLNHFINMGYDLYPNKLNIVLINDLSTIGTQLAQIKNSKKGTIIFVDLGAIRKEIKDAKILTTANAGWINVIKNLVKKIKQDISLHMFVLDSMSALYVLSKFENPRIELFYIFEFLRDLDVTAFLISEMPLDGSRYSEFGVEDYLADGIVHLGMSQFRRAVVREISVVKMRATDVNNDVFSLEFKNGKFYALYGGQNPLL